MSALELEEANHDLRLWIPQQQQMTGTMMIAKRRSEQEEKHEVSPLRRRLMWPKIGRCRVLAARCGRRGLRVCLGLPALVVL